MKILPAFPGAGGRHVDVRHCKKIIEEGDRQ